MAVALSFGGEGSTSPTSVLRLCVIVGGVTMLNAFWNCLVLLCHPSFREQRGMRLLSDPWAKDTGGKGSSSGGNGSGYSATASADELLVAYLRNNPEVARKAMQGAVAVAVQPGASAAGGAVLAAAAGGVVANAAAGGKSSGTSTAGAAAAPAAGPGAPGNRERGKSGGGGSFLAVLNPFRGTPKPHAGGASGSGSVVDVADFPEPAGGGKARGSRAPSAIAGDATVAHNPFHNVGAGAAAAGAAGGAAPGAAGAAAGAAAPGLGALERGESAANVFAMEASLDASSYGRPPSVRINGPGGAPAAAQATANPFG